MGEDDDDPMTALHRIGGSRHHSDADAHGGKATSSNDVMDDVGEVGGSTYNNQPKTGSDWATMA